MRHHKLRGQLGLKAAHREALLRNLLLSLLKHERIQTTIARAKELKRFTDPIIEIGKTHGWEQVRMARRSIHDKEALKKLFEVYGPRFKNRAGGYTRIFRLGLRKGDSAKMGLIEILPEPDKENEPRIILTKHEKQGEEAQQHKKKRKHTEAENIKKGKVRAAQESQEARQHLQKDTTHSYISRGKADKGAVRSKATTKKGSS